MVTSHAASHSECMENTLPRALDRERAPLDFWLSLVLALFLLLLAALALFVPIDAAAGFGIALAHPLDAFYLRVKGDRDLASAVVVIALLVLGERRALGAFVAAATIEPICDMFLSIADARGHVGYALAIHGSAALYCMLLSWRLLRKS